MQFMEETMRWHTNDTLSGSSVVMNVIVVLNITNLHLLVNLKNGNLVYLKSKGVSKLLYYLFSLRIYGLGDWGKIILD